MSTPSRGHKRWGVVVRNYSYGKPLGDGFLAGRYYDPEIREEPARGDRPEIVTYDTRREARAGAGRMRCNILGWRTTAVPVRVLVTVEVLDATA